MSLKTIFKPLVDFVKSRFSKTPETSVEVKKTRTDKRQLTRKVAKILQDPGLHPEYLPRRQRRLAARQVASYSVGTGLIR